jgi:hypothetical protein
MLESFTSRIHRGSTPMVQRQDTVALAPFTWHVFTHYQSAAAKKGHVLATASDCHMAADLPGVLDVFCFTPSFCTANAKAKASIRASAKHNAGSFAPPLLLQQYPRIRFGSLPPTRFSPNASWRRHQPPSKLQSRFPANAIML